ncbi:glycosyl hydrolase family 43 [Mucilaginibacter limnophilus]|uniref:Glycosyl hydrolase family 43 n=1 Tax=Mucilaginibacter limnophilus TaxID=1932778 RepID=A0A3S2V876_9SPHI|nr:glycoside hydrolase family 43 protein [Mucilaginibacter limnophilus]RVU00983.1 glycosyl hydrolase family 43 [Mucilaginibacter limnophilus]
MKYFTRIYIVFTSAVLLAGCAKEHAPNLDAQYQNADTITRFINPIKKSALDPYVTFKDGFYYYMSTGSNYLTLSRLREMIFLDQAYSKTIYTPPADSAFNTNVSKPEIHFLDGKWYVYFSADNGQPINRRIYAIENNSIDPLLGNWEFKGKVADPAADFVATDGSVLEYDGQLYFLWSGFKTTPTSETTIERGLYIAKMKNPYTLEGGRVLISDPTKSWERDQYIEDGKTFRVAIDQNPQVIKNSAGDVFISFTAGPCQTDNISLGLLSLKSGADPMIASNWVKSSLPVFSSSRDAYGPAFNGFFKSADGKEDWIIYNANLLPGQGCGTTRSPRIQKFSWNSDGTPNFGTPAGTTLGTDSLSRPSK